MTLCTCGSREIASLLTVKVIIKRGSISVSRDFRKPKNCHFQYGIWETRANYLRMACDPSTDRHPIKSGNGSMAKSIIN